MKPYDLNFTTGDIDEAIKIIKEAASWLVEKDEPLWFSTDIGGEISRNQKNDFVVLYEKEQSAAAMILNRTSRGMWEDESEGAYIHKLSVKREYAGQGFVQKMMEYAIDYCRQNKIRFLRLDCDAKREKLCGLYKRSGFKRVDTKHFKNTKYGGLEVALYQMDISDEEQFRLKWDGKEFWLVYKGEECIMGQADIRDAYDFAKGRMFDHILCRLTVENKDGTVSTMELFPPRWIF